MTINRPPVSVPTDLPIARLYLDDVKDVVQMLLDAEKKLNVEPRNYVPDDEVGVTFKVGQGARERTCDTIDELPKVTKRTNDFEIEVSRPLGYRATISIGRYANKLRTSGLSDDDEVIVFHKVEHVFAQRKLRWRTFCHSIPFQTAIMFPSFGCLVTTIAVFLLVVFRWWSMLGVVVATWVVLICGTVGTVRGSAVVFHNFSEHDEIAREKRGKILGEVFKAVLYFLVGVAVGVVAPLVLHKFWPTVKF